MILLNGKPQDLIPASDRGLHYGDGVFETLAINNGKPQFWTAHMERLLDGCSRLVIPLPDVACLKAETTQVADGCERAVIKIIITRGSGGRGYRPPASPEPQRLVMHYPWPDYVVPQEGITLRQCLTPLSCNPRLAGIKHLNRLEQVMARAEWGDDLVHEGLMLDLDGNVIEGTMSNLFAVRNGVLLTPDLTRCGVAGVMRHQVLLLAHKLGITCEIVQLRAAELEGMDELFVTNSVIGIWPVSCLGEARYGEAPITQRLISALNLMMEQN